MSDIEPLQQRALEYAMQINNKRIYFGHQSVGSDLLSGISAICPAISIRQLPDEPAQVLSTAIYHSRIGQNGDPGSKLDNFRSTIERFGDQIDIAFMKFCYVDILRDTDVRLLFDHYRKCMEEIEDRFPKLRLMHMTTPLRSVRLGVRSWIQKGLGKVIGAEQDNRGRENYNALLRKYFHSGNDLFDLAAFEAGPAADEIIAGTRKHPGQLYRPYTSDGGHLNAQGASTIGCHLIEAIGKV